MEDSDAKKRLNLGIYDYMVKNNMHEIADTFAQETGIVPETVAHDDGLLTRWSSFLSDTYPAKRQKKDDNAGTSGTSLHSGFDFKQSKRLQPTNEKLLCVDFSTKGDIIVAAGHDTRAFIWNLQSSTRGSAMGHSQLITDIRFMPKSNYFATSSYDGSVKMWNAKNGKKISDFIGHVDRVMSLDFHPNQDNFLCSCDTNEDIRFWNIKEAECLRSFKGGNRRVRFQPTDGILLAAATGNVINLIDVETSTIKYRFEGHVKDISSISWNVFGTYLVSVSEDSARVWSLSNGGRCIYQLTSAGNNFLSCVYHPAAHYDVVAIGSYQSIDTWDPPAMGNNSRKTFQAHGDMVSGLARESETNRIASVSHDQCIKVWESHHSTV